MEVERLQSKTATALRISGGPADEPSKDCTSTPANFSTPLLANLVEIPRCSALRMLTPNLSEDSNTERDGEFDDRLQINRGGERESDENELIVSPT